jgi:hypothetical protein
MNDDDEFALAEYQSRRGRPRLIDGPTPSERTAAWRRDLAAKGGRRLELALSAEANAALAAITGRTGETDTAAVERVLLAAAAKFL